MEMNAQANIDDVLEEIDRFARKGKNLAPLFSEIANHLYNVTEEALESETAPDGTRWQPLSPITIARKGHDRMLDDKGDMRESISYDSDKSSASIGTNVVSKDGYPYPAVHQIGSEDGKIPARQFMPFDNEGDLIGDTKEELIELVIDYFQN